MIWVGLAGEHKVTGKGGVIYLFNAMLFPAIPVRKMI